MLGFHPTAGAPLGAPDAFLGGEPTLAYVVEAISLVTGTLRGNTALVGRADGQSDSASNLIGIGKLTGLSEAVASPQCGLSRLVFLRSTSLAQTEALGRLSALVVLSGSIAATADTQAALRLIALEFPSEALGISVLDGRITGRFLYRGSVSGLSSIQAPAILRPLPVSVTGLLMAASSIQANDPRRFVRLMGEVTTEGVTVFDLTSFLLLRAAIPSTSSHRARLSGWQGIPVGTREWSPVAAPADIERWEPVNTPSQDRWTDV